MKPKSSPVIRNPRLFFVIFGILVLHGALIFNLYRLQIEKGEYYSNKAAAQRGLLGDLNARRGNIYISDKNNNHIPAALNKTYQVIFAVPKEIEDVQEAAGILSDILGLDREEIIRSLSKQNDLYELIVRKATADQIKSIQEASIKGVYIEDEDYRFYPFGELGSQLLGFVGAASEGRDSGKYGVESFYEDILRGEPGEIQGDKVKKSVPGRDVYLTIDRNIQARAEEILQGIAEKYQADSGTVIVEEPSTGKILALGNYPNFDPNNYSKYPLGFFGNPAVQSLYEPGSILKVITVASGLDAGKITPETKYYDTGSLTLNGKTIKNWDLKSHGYVTIREVIEQSINTGAAFAEAKLGHDNFYNYLVKFGLKEKTGIDLPGEIPGNLRNLEKSFREINFASAAFGQGISLTPIALINAFSAIANGGMLMRPYISADLNPEFVGRVISKEATEAITKIMISAVDKAEVAHIPKYYVAGKTGTAQIPDFKKGGYTDNVVNTYAGYAPAYDPRFVILIKIENPAGAPLAGATVVPAFRELAQFILNYYNVPPDYE